LRFISQAFFLTDVLFSLLIFIFVTEHTHADSECSAIWIGSSLGLFSICQFNGYRITAIMNTQKTKTQKLVPTEYNGKWGFLDAATGEEVVPFIYDYAHVFFCRIGIS
jgi:hypothetical protein